MRWNFTVRPERVAWMLRSGTRVSCGSTPPTRRRLGRGRSFESVPNRSGEACEPSNWSRSRVRCRANRDLRRRIRFLRAIADPHPIACIPPRASVADRPRALRVDLVRRTSFFHDHPSSLHALELQRETGTCRVHAAIAHDCGVPVYTVDSSSTRSRPIVRICAESIGRGLRTIELDLVHEFAAGPTEIFGGGSAFSAPSQIPIPSRASHRVHPIACIRSGPTACTSCRCPRGPT